MTLRQPTSKRYTANGLDLHYLDWGNEGADPIVCVHGYTGSAVAFNGMARHFCNRFRIVALDVRGHGESAWSPDGAYQYADQVSDLAAFVDHLGLARFTLIGTSMGGIISMAYAADHAERLARLVINDIGPDQEAGSTRITQMVGSRPESFPWLDEAIEYRRDTSPITAARSPQDQRELALGVVKQRADGRWVWKMDPAYITQRVERGAPKRPPLWPVLERLQCPTMLIWGTDSDVILEPQARRMIDVLPRGELVVVPGVGHAPALIEEPVIQALEKFLASKPV
jgi:pimeloyl-ACP methyl ester carboxylesterase